MLILMIQAHKIVKRSAQNVIDGLHGKTNVVLMHDASGKMGSAKAG